MGKTKNGLSLNQHKSETTGRQGHLYRWSSVYDWLPFQKELGKKKKKIGVK